MMELPEMLTYARQINEALIGKTVVRAEANHSPHGFAWYTGDPASYGGILAGKRVTGAGTNVDTGVSAYDSTLYMYLEDETLLLSVSPRYYPAGAKRPDKHQLILEFDDGSAMTCTVRMWGSMFLFKKGDKTRGAPESYVFSNAPTPYDDAFTQEYFYNMMDNCPQKISVKALLATEQRVPGLGNGCLQDILWNARLAPKHKLSDLTDEQKAALYRATVDTMRAMADGDGRDTEKDLFGNPGGYKTICSNKRATGPCPACGGFIKREAYLGGNVYYCPVCQV